MLVRMEDLLREEIRGTIPRVSAAIHLCVHLTATPTGPIVDEVKPTAEMVQEDRIDFLRNHYEK
jgi:type IV secretion system protein VirB11